ncbi:SCO family protein [Flavimarina sp. Hel_I_48]|uniref:SCO family protein n=1 Tax=Flavimarina sp. Hel_I_48 TaxID=1392488 RepID=UPI0004DF3C2E|nr:SCO family protein [Flavimarina sp. Hel_I_48]
MNKKKTYIGIAVIVLIFGLFAIPKIFERLRNGSVVENDRLNVVNINEAENSSSELSYIRINDKDRRVPEFKLVNQNGDTITDKYYRGKVFLVEFFFTRCPDICIPMSENLVEIQKEFKDSDKFGIASISIDPEHDTPEVLKAYAKEYGATYPHWNFLTGSKDSIYTMANEKFGLLAQANPNVKDNFLHSGLFALIDQNGFIRSRMDNFGNPKIYYRGFIPRGEGENEDRESPEIDMLIEDINKLLSND